MNIAVTGLTGFLGNYVAKDSLKGGFKYGLLYGIPAIPYILKIFRKKISFVQGDLTDKEVLKKFVQSADVVIHMAYERQGATFREAANKDIKRFVEANLLGSIELLSASRQAGIKQFIFISSCAVYGHIFSNIKLDELHPLIPDSNYGAYKASVEAFLSFIFHVKGI